MPSKNTVKFYLENTYYHVYNRGVDGRIIFSDSQDYKVFLSLLKRYLLGEEEEITSEQNIVLKTHNEVQPRWRRDVAGKVKLAAYCLMPNHFHFLLKQLTRDGMTLFMRALMNSYVRYFNKRVGRYGGLFQSIYKAISIEEERYLLHLTRYIHLNPLAISDIKKHELADYYSSYGEYIGRRKTRWIYPSEILAAFGSTIDMKQPGLRSYQHFVEDFVVDDKEILESLIIE